MYIRDIMTTNVVTIPSNTSILRAKRIMEEGKFRRLPVVDKGKLVGLVTAHGLERVPVHETAEGMWELTYSLGTMYRTPVKRVMQKKVVTATPTMTVEEALAKAQSNRVGALVVVEDSDKVVGIVTTNDFFYRIVNPILGVGEPGQRIWVDGGGEGKAMEDIISTINKLCLKIITLHIMARPNKAEKDIVVHLDYENIDQLVTELETKGYTVMLRKR